MDYDWSRQKGVFVHPHPSTTQPFEPSGSVPLPHSIDVANLSAPPSQDTAQTVPLTHLSSSALPTENIPFYGMAATGVLSYTLNNTPPTIAPLIAQFRTRPCSRPPKAPFTSNPPRQTHL
ncbi:Uncharacterized protein HZ326_28628 [Fusarium oxysporum f. sp. albedinis]|nr:Uncharacterized protein HZ326_28628 [Fusarium oxysporum f. sp. albedinis]